MCIQITNAVSRFFAAVDRCDWSAVRALMTDSFHVDYSSYGGGPASHVTPAELTEVWDGLLPYFDSVHHQTGNLIVEQDGDNATVQCHGMATHYIADLADGDLQFVVGTYDLQLTKMGDDWKLSSMRFNFKFSSGNSNLAAEAQRRATNKIKEKSDA